MDREDATSRRVAHFPGRSREPEEGRQDLLQIERGKYRSDMGRPCEGLPSPSRPPLSGNSAGHGRLQRDSSQDYV